MAISCQQRWWSVYITASTTGAHGGERQFVRNPVAGCAFSESLSQRFTEHCSPSSAQWAPICYLMLTNQMCTWPEIKLHRFRLAILLVFWKLDEHLQRIYRVLWKEIFDLPSLDSQLLEDLQVFRWFIETTTKTEIICKNSSRQSRWCRKKPRNVTTAFRPIKLKVLNFFVLCHLMSHKMLLTNG